MSPITFRLVANVVLSAAILSVGLALAASGARAEGANFFTTTHVNMRAGPGTGHRIMDTVPDKQIVTVTGCVADQSWCLVEWDGRSGWLSSRFITRPAPLGSFALQAKILDIPVVDFERGMVIEPAGDGRKSGSVDKAEAAPGKPEGPIFVIYANGSDIGVAKGNRIVIPERTALPADSVPEETLLTNDDLLGADLS